ncbi:MAG: imidazolonepropionase [Myxococcota bacterium]
MKPGFELLRDAAFVCRDGRILWLGGVSEIPSEYGGFGHEPLGGRLVTPALIDCHTHLVFGGHRAHEFDQRLRGVSYEEISRSGGGIASTVSATRGATEEELLTGALDRADSLIADGVAVIEVKSGYGLTIEHELRMLRVAQELARQRPVHVVTTWLAAHAIPVEYRDRANDYIDQVAIPGLYAAHEEGLIDAVDGFCESIAFSPEQIRRVFDAAANLGLPVKLHAEQLSNRRGALLVAEYGGLSADHLEYLTAEDVPKLAAAGTVAVMLPGAFYTLRETQLPPIQALRDHNVPMAVATDCNPGSSPLTSLLTAMNMACVVFGLTPEEALAGATRNAAAALGLQDTYGQIEVGRSADLAVWNVHEPSELSYWQGRRALYRPIRKGQLV